MLLELAQWLAREVRLFNVFSYITLRAVLSCLTALAISLMLGPLVIRKLTAYKIGQSVRDDGPQTHLSKTGTPTMGGALILLSIGITTLLWGDLSNRFLWIVLLVTVAFGAIGWIDDYRKVVRRNPKGLSAKAKFFVVVVHGDDPITDLLGSWLPAVMVPGINSPAMAVGRHRVRGAVAVDPLVA